MITDGDFQAQLFDDDDASLVRPHASYSHSYLLVALVFFRQPGTSMRFLCEGSGLEQIVELKAFHMLPLLVALLLTHGSHGLGLTFNPTLNSIFAEPSW